MHEYCSVLGICFSIFKSSCLVTRWRFTNDVSCFVYNKNEIKLNMNFKDLNISDEMSAQSFYTSLNSYL